MTAPTSSPDLPYQLVFLGAGAAVDFPENKELADLVQKLYTEGEFSLQSRPPATI